ncbi:hypothetical protein GX48_07201 [Paracoccidioides brasiliensis]|nr:hypothetical protein GX48_07201 [Paracoccidioides brasiliensis]
MSLVMPAPSPRRPSNRGSAKSAPSTGKPLDIGQPLGIHDTNSVREKVRKWQQQGGGVITEKDVGPGSDSDHVSPDQNSRSSNRASDLRNNKYSSSMSKDDSKNKDHSVKRDRSISTPKKRVISDGHWRKNRSPPSTPPQKVTPRKKTDVFDRYGDSTSSAGEKGKTFEDSSGAKSGSKPLPDDGIRVYASSMPSPKKSERSKSQPTQESQSMPEEKEDGADSDQVRISKHHPPRKQKGKDDTRERHLRKTSVDNEMSTEPSEVFQLSEQENRPRRQGHKLPPRPLRPPKGGIFNHVIDESKKIFGKHEPPPAPRYHGSSVEAWLSSTPDPFSEGEDPLVEIPAPLSLSRREAVQRRRDDDDATSRPTPQLKNTKERRSSNGNIRRFHIPPLTDTTSVHQDDLLSYSAQPSEKSRDTCKSSPSTLKRTGVKKHPNTTSKTRKMSTLHESLDEALQGSNLGLHSSSDSSEVSLSDRPPPLTLRRPFPGTGVHRLSTIMSVETLSTATETVRFQDDKETDSRANPQTNLDEQLESEAKNHFDPNLLPDTKSGLKRRLTTHADLISVLSIPGRGGGSIRSARSIRTNRSRLATATVGDIMQEFSSDETKYIRELRTLVGGVIPVLLSSVLSKSDSAIAAGLFRPSGDPKDEENFTRPIVNMGIALERLKALHRRAPLTNPDSLLSWAQSAQKVYADYLKAWRLGFQDVVVNLAPPDEDPSHGINSETQSLYAGMPQDEDGDVVDGDGEKVDVAFLLKRPLVRLKYLAKTFKGINYVQTSPKAEEMAMVYQKLVTEARQRSNEERARLEDDLAAHIDATRARSPKSLAVLTDVSLHQNRRVQARDFFSLSLLHSSGQQIDCRAELLLRDNPPEEGPGGDLLICEVDETDRWLLFPPIDRGRASARNGDVKGEIVVMIRSVPGEEKDWQELLTFKTDDEQVGYEWVQMIGLSPVPPKIDQSLSFIYRSRERNRAPRAQKETADLCTSSRKRSSSPINMDVPIGEQATVLSSSTKLMASVDDDSDKTKAQPNGSHNYPCPKALPLSKLSLKDEKDPTTPGTVTRPQMSVPTPRNLNEAIDMASGPSPTTLKRSKAKRRSNYDDLPTLSPTSSGARTPDKEKRVSDIQLVGPKTLETKSIVRPQGDVQSARNRDSSPQMDLRKPRLARPLGRRSLSPVPSLELPTIPKLRKASQQSSPPESPKQEMPSPLAITSKSKASSAKRGKSPDEVVLRRDPTIYTEDVPLPPPHRSQSPAVSKKHIPVLSPTTPRNNKNRRSSSPLKHEYEPSTATESSDNSDTSTVEHHDIDSSSDTSDEELEGDDMATPLPPIGAHKHYKIYPHSSLPTYSEGTLAPSNTAFQAPHKSVPLQPYEAAKSIASIFYWHDKGSWEAVYPYECSIMITPGLIEAYEMSAAHLHPIGSSKGELGVDIASKRPLIALELTPLVPIRRGTALDISIRSPPMTSSKIKTGNNIMFRSRNAEECEKLYGLINQARINNLTYVALQNARGPFNGQPTSLTRQNSNRTSRFGGSFSWSRSSYRASSVPTASVAGVSDSSVGTMSSAFSALRKFGSGNKMFSIARSTITSRTGSQRGSLYSSSTRSGSNHTPNSQFEVSPDGSKNVAGSIGLSNAKIRLYVRESASKWRDMGAARLTILPVSPVSSPPGSAGAVGTDAETPSTEFANGEIRGSDGLSSSSQPPTAPPPPLLSNHQQEKRILIRGKTNGEELLDVCLDESCFERVARTGIAVSVWERYDRVAKQGGVVNGSFRVYMIQMKSEAETAYTFGLVGKLRY